MISNFTEHTTLKNSLWENFPKIKHLSFYITLEQLRNVHLHFFKKMLAHVFDFKILLYERGLC